MNRVFAIALLALTLASGCAATSRPLPEPSGRSLGDGMHQLVQPDRVNELEEADTPWSPNLFYPAIGAHAGSRPVDRTDRVELALAAQGPRPMASRSSTAGAAWMFFKLYSNTWSRADGSTCRFAPTCSGFGRQAVSQHGLLGLVMTFGRLHRNHSDADFYASKGPRLVDPVRFYDFWFRDPSATDRQSYPSIDLYLRLREAQQFALPAPPVAPAAPTR